MTQRVPARHSGDQGRVRARVRVRVIARARARVRDTVNPNPDPRNGGPESHKVLPMLLVMLFDKWLKI